MNHLIARQTGVYGLYAFNTIGGPMLNSEALLRQRRRLLHRADAAAGQADPTIVRNVDGWGSPLGFSATNMRYVTITKSRFYNNALGIAPNALDGEKYPPAEDNVIIDNDIFWNNFNFHEGNPPFKVRKTGAAALAPVGTGISCSAAAATGSRTTASTATTSTGVAAVEGILVEKTPQAESLDHNVDPEQPVRPQRHRHQRLRRQLRRQRHQQLLLARRRDLDVPRRSLHVRGLRRHERVQPGRAGHELIGWTGDGALNGWKKHPHPAKPGYTPLEVFK